jgi:hypothetical protein
MHLLIVAGAAAEAVGGQDKVSPVARAKAKGLARGILVADYAQAISTLQDRLSSIIETWDDLLLCRVLRVHLGFVKSENRWFHFQINVMKVNSLGAPGSARNHQGCQPHVYYASAFIIDNHG